MDIQSKEDLNAQVEFNKLDKIKKIEDKLHRLSFMPLYFFAFLMLAYVGLDWGKNQSGAIITIIIVICIFGQSSVKRTDLLKELLDLKYGK